MRATILPSAIILTKDHRAAVSMMAKRSIVTRVLPLRCFLFLLPNHIHVFAFIMQQFSYIDKYCNRNTSNLQYPPLLTSGG